MKELAGCHIVVTIGEVVWCFLAVTALKTRQDSTPTWASLSFPSRKGAVVHPRAHWEVEAELGPRG